MSRERRCSPEAWLSSFCCPTKWKVCRLLSLFFASAVCNFAVSWSLVFSTPSTMFFAAPFSWNRFYKIIFIWATIVTLQFIDKNGNHLCPVLLILSDTHTISINIKVLCISLAYNTFKLLHMTQRICVRFIIIIIIIITGLLLFLSHSIHGKQALCYCFYLCSY